MLWEHTQKKNPAGLGNKKGFPGEVISKLRPKMQIEFR